MPLDAAHCTPVPTPATAQRRRPRARPTRTASSSLAEAVLQIVARIQEQDNLNDAARLLVQQIQQAVGCDSVALGMVRGRRPFCRLAAVSGVVTPDRKSEHTLLLEAAMDEAVSRDGITIWPTPDDTAAPALTHEQLACRVKASCVASFHLRCANGQTVGALVLCGDERLGTSSGLQTFLQTLGGPLSSCLKLHREAQRGFIASRLTSLTRRGKLLLMGVAMLVAVAMVLPVTYRVGCDAELQPVSRRFVVAPYEGLLDRSFAEPGDVVSRGDRLAAMDDREIRLQQAALDAKYEQAKKRREVALAKRDGVDAQLARLEMRNLRLELDLLERRAECLDIKSPTDGIVVSGDLKRVEGAPLTVGQALYEIAPLNEMIVELAVPEDEMTHVRPGDPVSLRLNAFPGKSWNGTVGRIHPRTELIDEQSVFVAEFRLDNPNDSLRPGMNGRAKINVGRKLLAWNLFHKPVEAALARLGW